MRIHYKCYRPAGIVILVKCDDFSFVGRNRQRYEAQELPYNDRHRPFDLPVHPAFTMEEREGRDETTEDYSSLVDGGI